MSRESLGARLPIVPPNMLNIRPRRGSAVAWRALLLRTRELPSQFLAEPALVFSPHFDDETLGCGGTILRKRLLGCPVGVVFMTDGKQSHSAWIDKEKLGKQRKRESARACDVLGVTSVYFLNLRERNLRQDKEKALVQVIDILDERKVRQVFVPARNDGLEDHAATFEIVTDALRRTGARTRVFEYPIWLWNQWPWTKRRPSGGSNLARRLVRTTRHVARFYADYNWHVDISKVLPEKARALEQYKSQMNRPQEHDDWPVLADVQAGEFLTCFFRSHEIFAEYEL